MKQPMQFVACTLFLCLGSNLTAQECAFNPFHTVTNDFFFSASSDQGARGDVVAVDVSLTIEQFHGQLAYFHLVACYDANVVEMLEEPLYSSIFDQITFESYFFHIGEAPRPQRPSGGLGFDLIVNLRTDVATKLFATGEPILLLTAFFRLKGQPGESSDVRFCDDEFIFKTGACLRNEITYYPARLDPVAAASTRHQSGLIRVLDGPPTHPDPPALPPNAKVYPEAPTPETAHSVFELTGGVVQPGSTGVPVSLYITSNYEFSGFLASLRFPNYVYLARVEEHTRPGAVTINNVGGYAGIAMLNSRRRIGAEGERVKVATFYFDVREAARDVSAIELRLEDSDTFQNRVAISYTGGLDVSNLPVVAQVQPLVVTAGLLKVQTEPAKPGDANFDGRVDLADAVAILGDLFLGGTEMLCPQAADFNMDGRVDVSDPIAILSYLFLSAPPPQGREIFCGAGR